MKQLFDKVTVGMLVGLGYGSGSRGGTDGWFAQGPKLGPGPPLDMVDHTVHSHRTAVLLSISDNKLCDKGTSFSYSEALKGNIDIND